MKQSRVTSPKITAFLKEQCGWSRGIRYVLEKYGLNFEENCLKYYKTNRNVQTASSYQVRKPMYKDSIGSWKNYKKDIQILIKLLNNNKNEKHKSNRSK